MLTLTKEKSFIFIFLLLILISFACYKKPVYNWDLLPYSALVLSRPGVSCDSVHKLTYEKVREQIPIKDFQLLTDTSNYYRYITLNDAEFFSRELRYYKIKPLFIEFVSFFYWLGFPLVISTVLPSLLAYFLTGIIIFLWISKHYSPERSLLLSSLLILLPFMIWTARTSSPDMLNALFILTGLYFLWEKNKLWIGLPFIFFSVFIRPDSILIFGLLLIWLNLGKSISIKASVLLFTIALIAILAILKWNSFDGEVLFIQQSSTDRISHRLTNLNLTNYLFGLVKGLKSLLYSNLIFVLLFLITFNFFAVVPYKLSVYFKQNKLIFFLLVHIFLLYLIRPNIEDRFIIADYLCALLLTFSLNSKSSDC